MEAFRKPSILPLTLVSQLLGHPGLAVYYLAVVGYGSTRAPLLDPVFTSVRQSEDRMRPTAPVHYRS
jgi:hypothetical protein